MHVTNPQSALLSNHEVLLHLRTEEAEYTGEDGTGRERKKPSGLEHVLRDGLHYLNSEDFNTVAITETHPNRPMTLYKGPHSLFRALAPKYRLNKAEYLQLYNIRPTTQVMLDLVIEESSTRFTEEELEDILQTIQTVFDEEEASIPRGVENMEMERIPKKMLAANKNRKRGRRKA
ncbi:hypothetical protein BS50DRAFT_569516 [Corynespora cassiicola Philippines]|uniref:DNA-directed RNA polymerase III subunit RPC9 n=1 Tax=Corynespora cassiicola Philippines TaxID=1448308 RepID=A0A2T2P2K5_CORCC|nr:hypothetical protein BS50DRAFT_569516 [Corynespora cassiicola Philippines]